MKVGDLVGNILRSLSGARSVLVLEHQCRDIGVQCAGGIYTGSRSRSGTGNKEWCGENSLEALINESR